MVNVAKTNKHTNKTKTTKTNKQTKQNKTRVLTEFKKQTHWQRLEI